jgi:large subunit ribosomal protein L5
LGYKNLFQVPKITKIVVSSSFGKDAQSQTIAENVRSHLTAIAGQKAVFTRAKTSIAGFKLREGMIIGCKVTLRGDLMYHLLEKLVYCALPRVRDFRGFKPDSFDGKGNLSFGIPDYTVFPEISYDAVDKTRGMNITIVTTATKDHDAAYLLKHFDLPIIEEK